MSCTIPSLADVQWLRLVKVKVILRQSVGQSVLVSGTHLRPATNFSLSLFVFSFDSFGFIDAEVGPVLFSFCRASPAQPFSDLSPTGLMSIVYCLYFWDSLNQEGQVPVFISLETGQPNYTLGYWVCLINLHIIICYIYSSYMYNTYIRPLLVYARTADYALSKVALSKGPNRVGSSSPHLKAETDPVSETLCFLVNRNDGQSPETQWFWKIIKQLSKYQTGVTKTNNAKLNGLSAMRNFSVSLLIQSFMFFIV
jgi:hypothetical protein